MIERGQSNWLLASLLAMAMTDGLPGLPGTSRGRPFQPAEPSEKQKEQLAKDAAQIQQLHRFVIKGKEVYARNKKDALKRLHRQSH